MLGLNPVPLPKWDKAPQENLRNTKEEIQRVIGSTKEEARNHRVLQKVFHPRFLRISCRAMLPIAQLEVLNKNQLVRHQMLENRWMQAKIKFQTANWMPANQTKSWMRPNKVKISFSNNNPSEAINQVVSIEQEAHRKTSQWKVDKPQD